ncbi:MAG: CHAP domain-containing protein [Actinomycetota bacterium]
MIRGADWYGGQGVDVRSGLQGMELAKRFYEARGWGTVRAGGDGCSRNILREEGDRTVQLNGALNRIVPGDLVVWDSLGNGAGKVCGHVAVVDTVTPNQGGSYSIRVVEQSPSGSAGLILREGTLTRLNGPTSKISGVVHDAQNHSPFPLPYRPDLEPKDPARTSARRQG